MNIIKLEISKLPKLALKICTYSFILLISGCASISSEFVCSNKTNSLIDENDVCADSSKVAVDDGIVYYMPQRPIRITVDVGNATAPLKNKKITLTVVDNYADETLSDTKNVFLLRYNKNLVGDNNMAVGVNNVGLLSVTHADTINKFNEIAANIAIDAASIGLGAGFVPSGDAGGGQSRSALSTFAGVTAPAYQGPKFNSVSFDGIDSTCPNSTYSILLEPGNPNKMPPMDSPMELCGFNISIEPLSINQGLKNSIRIDAPKFSEGIWVNTRHFLRKARNFLDFLHTQNTLDSVPGIFYKQDITYKVNVHAIGRPAEETATMIASSPNESKIFFAPITETVFTDNTSDITLLNGVVTSLKENTDSELLALSTIPAKFLGAYTNATGEIFKSLGTVSTNKTGLDTAQMGALLQGIKLRQCQQAIAINNTNGKTGDELTKALSNINAACSTGQ
jgi:hypothetical protein